MPLIEHTSAGAVSGSFDTVWYTILMYVPSVLTAIAVFIMGWIVGIILFRAIVEIVRITRIDEALRKTVLHEVAMEAGFQLRIGVFFGSLAMFFVMLVGLLAALDILGLVRVTVFLSEILLTIIPQVLAASLIIILAAVVADWAKRIISGSARVAGAHGSANLAGSVAKWAIWVFAILTALDQLGIAQGFEQMLFAGLVIAVSLASGLAFGLGGKDAARDFIEYLRSEIKHTHQE